MKMNSIDSIKFGEYIYINLINSLLLIYLDLKTIATAAYNILYSPNIFKFSYKKFFKYTVNGLKIDLFMLITPLIKIIEISKYSFQRYILKYSFIKFIIIYMKDINFTNIRKHIFNELDLYHIYKNLINKSIKTLKTFYNEYKTYKSDSIYIINHSIINYNKPSLTTYILNTTGQDININNVFYTQLHNEIKLTNELLDLLCPVLVLSIVPLNEKEIINCITKLIIKFIDTYIQKLFGINKVFITVKYYYNLISKLYYKDTSTKTNFLLTIFDY